MADTDKIDFACPHCERRFVALLKYAGGTILCPRCGGSLMIPSRPAAHADPAGGRATKVPPKDPAKEAPAHQAMPRKATRTRRSGETAEYVVKPEDIPFLRNRQAGLVTPLLIVGMAGFMVLIPWLHGDTFPPMSETLTMAGIGLVVGAGFSIAMFFGIGQRCRDKWMGTTVTVSSDRISAKEPGASPFALERDEIARVSRNAMGFLVVSSRPFWRRLRIPESISRYDEISATLEEWGHPPPSRSLAMLCVTWYTGVAAILGILTAFCAVRSPLVVVPAGIFLLGTATCFFAGTIKDPSLTGWSKLNELRALLCIFLLILLRLAAALLGKL